LPRLEEFLESPEEMRLRRLRAGVITALVGLGVTLALLWASRQSEDLLPFVALGMITFFVGFGVFINGLFLTVPRKTLANNSAEAESQKELESQIQNLTPANQLRPFVPTTNDLTTSFDQRVGRTSVTEHTTHHLKNEKETDPRNHTN